MYNSFDDIQMDMEYIDLSIFAKDELFVKRRSLLKWRRKNRTDINIDEVDAYIGIITTEIETR